VAACASGSGTSRQRFGLRRQSDRDDGAFERTTGVPDPTRAVRAKAVSPLCSATALQDLAARRTFHGQARSTFSVLVWLALVLATASARAAQPTNPPIILTVEGTNVFIQRVGSRDWDPAYPNQILAARDRGRTGIRSRTSVRLSDLSVMHIAERSEFEIKPLPDPKVEAEFSLFRGLLYLLNRDRPGKHRFITPTATAATRGTEFTLEVEEATGRTLLTVLEGEAELGNSIGSVILASGEQGVAVPGQMPTKTAVIDTTNIVQWCLYYPGVLDLDELELAAGEQLPIADSLTAYRSGDLLRAVSGYPADRTPASDSEKVYLAALLLAVGNVTQAEALFASMPAATTLNSRPARLANALRLVIATVKRRSAPSDLGPRASGAAPPLATELLARSYREQAGHRLDDALASAKLAVEKSPQFAFGWARVAELEFSQGRAKPALAALEKSLVLAQRNAQAIALKGFLLSAQNRIREAITTFDQAIEIDGGLGNAWLGRGLCRIRQGRAEEGRFDLQVAATMEPQRSLLRSYLGKAFSNAGDARHAEKELRLAREIDAGDPTPLLYSALLLQQQNRINEGVRDLQQSQALNENRALYRSQLLLDQDRAVRGANLANLYRDAGMIDVSVREAGRAVSADYANSSAHLFLANSFNELRDPRRVNQRYETAWFSEYLVGNLLAPVGAGALSQTVSQQEYSKLFEQDRFGIVNDTTYASHGQWIQNAAQFGTFGNLSYAAEVFYNTDNGWRPNNDWEQLSTALTLKYQITAQDSVYVRASYETVESGDPAQYYKRSESNPVLRLEETQEPFVIAGYHHEWRPGVHTLLLAGRFDDTLRASNPTNRVLFFNRLLGPISSVSPLPYDQSYRDNQVLYAVEAQQIWRHRDHTFLAGARFQAGDHDTRNAQNPYGPPVVFPIDQSFENDLQRQTYYLYDQWQFWPTLTLVGGVSYDRVEFPENFRYGPISDAEETRDQVSPKAGVVFTPFKDTTIRGAYFRSLGGVSIDQSVRLEPSQVAGFNQAYRSLIPESVAGDNSAPTFDTWAFSIEQKLGRGTFLGVSAEIHASEVKRRVGVIEFRPPPVPGPALFAETTRERLDYNERSLAVTFNQLLSDEWSIGAAYRISKADLEDTFPDVPASAAIAPGFQLNQNVEAVLQQVYLSAFYNHPSGFFGGASGIWNLQSNQGYSPDKPGDDFWQFNVEAGWRFLRRRLEARVALLNITDRDYRLNPLNLTSELPHGREIVTSLRFNF
jgi:tetratricopeptide (TPR) repeat protein